MTWFKVHLHFNNLFELALGGLMCRRLVILDMKVAYGLLANISE